MIFDFFYRIPRRARILIAFIVILLVAYFILRFLPATTRVIPQDFLQARQNASRVAQDIVELSSLTAYNLQEIAELDKQRKYKDALKLVNEELERNRLAREKGIELSVILGEMATSLESISPASISQIGLQAVSTETTLISHLLVYNDYLAQLLFALEQRFSGAGNVREIEGLVAKINVESQAINELNRKFNRLMRQFDELE